MSEAPDDSSLLATSSDPEQRRRYVRYLEGVTDFQEDEIAGLFKLLGDEDWRVRRDALDVALAMADDRFARRCVDGIMQNDQVGLRNACIELARAMGGGYIREVEAHHAEEPSPLLLDGIGAGGSEGIEFVARHATGEDVNRSAAAIAALSRIGGGDARAVLMDLLTAEEHHRVLSALEGLREMGATLRFEQAAPLLESRILWRSASE